LVFLEVDANGDGDGLREIKFTQTPTGLVMASMGLH
jgi:hypothetical protein